MSPNEESRASGGSPAPDEWYFKVIGEELGPFTFDELVSFAEQGYLSAAAEVKIGHSGSWTRVEAVDRLVAVLPSQDPPVPSPPPVDLEPKLVQDAQSSAPAPVAASAAIGLLSLAPQNEKADGPALVPAPQSVAAVKSTASSSAKATAEQIAELDLIKAQTAHTALGLATKQLIASAFSTNSDQTWWGWIDGVQYGPVDFVQVVEWVTAGRLRPTDFVRYGANGQYTPVGSIPGLLHASNIISQATEVMLLAISRVMTAKTAAAAPMFQPSVPMMGLPPSPVAPAQAKEPVPAVTVASLAPIVAVPPMAAASSPPSVSEPQVAKPSVADVIPPQPAKVVSPVTSPVGNLSASLSSGMSTPRPAVPASRKPAKHHQAAADSPLSLVMEKLKEPRIAGGAAAVLAVLLLLMAWMLSPPAADPADVARYRELKKLLDDVRAKRAAKDKDFKEIRARAEKLKTDYVAALKNADNKHPDKQALLWAVQDELPRIMKQKLTIESQAEKDFAKRIDEAAKLMRIRP